MPSDPIVSLEIGTSKVRALVGECQENGHIMITGLGECPSQGVSKSEIVHFDHALACVRHALQMAEEQSNVAIRQVHLVITGGHVQSILNHGLVPVSGPEGEITEEDIERVTEIAKTVNLPHDRVALHTIRQHFYIDDQKGVINPVGMEGSQLGLDMLILHVIRNRVRNTVRVLKSADVDVPAVAFSGLCSALAVLSAEQKEIGAIIINIGGGTTDYVAYAHKCISCAGSFAVGGDHITNDIAVGLNLSMSQAEALKIESGDAILNSSSRGQTIPLVSDSGLPGRFIQQTDLQAIINARMEEIFCMIRAELERYNLVGAAGAGVILTGGGSYLKNITELAQQVFGLPCRIGVPRGVSGLAAVAEGPAYAAPLGIIRYGFKAERKDPLQENWMGRIKKKFFQRESV